MKKGEKMKKYIKLSAMAAFSCVFVTTAAVSGMRGEESSPPTLVDYLNGKNISFLIVNTGMNARLTTFGWQDAAKTCKNIRTAGFNVSNVSNYAADTREETNAVCKY